MNDKQDIRYEMLHENMTDYAHALHKKNNKRIRSGIIVLLLLPIILGTIRWLTNSDKIVFLLIWVLCMFAISAYLVSVEYLDHSIQKKIKEMTEDAEKGGGE